MFAITNRVIQQWSVHYLNFMGFLCHATYSFKTLTWLLVMKELMTEALQWSFLSRAGKKLFLHSPHHQARCRTQSRGPQTLPQLQKVLYSLRFPFAKIYSFFGLVYEIQSFTENVQEHMVLWLGVWAYWTPAAKLWRADRGLRQSPAYRVPFEASSLAFPLHKNDFLAPRGWEVPFTSCECKAAYEKAF